MEISMEAIFKALVEDINTNYKNINELSKEMGYTSPVYLSRKVKQLKIGTNIKGNILLSPKEQEILKNSIVRREKKDDEVILS